MGFGRWPLGLRAWIHHPTRNFHRSRKIQSDNPTSSLTFHPTLFPSFQSPNDPPPSIETHGLDTEDPAFRTYAFQLKWEILLDSLSRDRANPNRVWEAYCDVGSLVGFEKIPLRIHQQTLRRAVPPKERLGSIIANRFQAERKPSVPHLYEGRLQTIIRNIRESGFQPGLEDYHFILAQFAAVAYPDGCRAVFRELVYRQNHRPSYKTYGLCLQAIAHRLTLPCPYRYRKDLLSYASRMCFELLDDMRTRGVALTSVNFDLTHRIFKATENWTIYEHLLKMGYGIDLANPDRLALEIQGQTLVQISPSPSAPVESSELSQEYKPIPFNTAALNTLIDALGSRGEVSRMVTAFEVLTNPLPNMSSEVQWPDDDEDDPPFYHLNARTSHVYPTAKPNTKTFIFLIRHMAKARQNVFVRHYLNLAFEMDRSENFRLRNELMSGRLNHIEAPRLAITRAMLLPFHGLGNRMRHRPSLRWAYWMTRQAIHDKEENLKFYAEWREKYQPAESPDEDSSSGFSGYEGDSECQTEDKLKSLSQSDKTILDNQTLGVPPILRIDFDTPATEKEASEANSDFIKKPFQIDLHIALLERNIQELEELRDRTRNALKRSTHRLKEKLGRRVWSVKDIFLTSKGQRVHLDRREWIKAVGFGTSGVGRGMGNLNAQIKRDLPRWMEDDDEEAGEQNAIP